MARDSRLMAHGPRLMAHGSRLVAHGSWLMTKKNGARKDPDLSHEPGAMNLEPWIFMNNIVAEVIHKYLIQQ